MGQKLGATAGLKLPFQHFGLDGVLREDIAGDPEGGASDALPDEWSKGGWTRWILGRSNGGGR